MRRTNRSTCFLLSTLLLVAMGCSGGEEPAPKPELPADVGTPEVPEATADTTLVSAALAKADALDGNVDMVVHKCANCALGMDGKAEHSVKALDYTMHFCQDGCAKKFSEKLNENILAMTIPGN